MNYVNAWMFLLLAVIPIIASEIVVEDGITLNKYYTHSELEQILKGTHKECESITHVRSVGKSEQNRDLWVIVFAKNTSAHQPGVPDFKYVGNMHGNEAVGNAILINFVQYLCKRYNQGDQEIVRLVDNVAIHIMPTMNPDGYAKALHTDMGNYPKNYIIGRNNANNVDLNRNFPDFDRIACTTKETSHLAFNREYVRRASQGLNIQKETIVMMEWMMSNYFVASANFHGGDLVSNYPYDEACGRKSGIYNACPDDAIFRQLAHAYSNGNNHMKDSKGCSDEDNFVNGITNGANWYSIGGGMQDFNYLATNCFEITVEMGCEKFPDPSFLPRLWNENKQALINYAQQATCGVKGFVTEEGSGRGIPGVRIIVKEVDHPVLTAPDGDFWRLLAPGKYHIRVSALGFEDSAPQRVVVPHCDPYSAVRLDFVLRKHSLKEASEETQETLELLKDVLESINS